MNTFELASDLVRLEVTETGAQLGEVTFTLQGEGGQPSRLVRPMHTAPWAGEALDDVPPMLRVLRGDFFAAPFGDSDLLADEDRPHGRSANGTWHQASRDDGRLELALDGQIMGAAVRKVIELRHGEPVVYQRHVLEGGSGRLPLGHHAMLRAHDELRLSFAPWSFAGTPPQPIERPPEGRSALRYPQRFSDLSCALLADGGEIDLTRYPTLDSHEDLWMLVSQPGQQVAWTAATSASGGWVWFSLKDRRTLPQTVVWLSNGGRDYPPFSGRHRKVIGLEEVCAYFHLGHRASVAHNELSREGIPTSIRLEPDRPTVVPYIFGLASIPPGFGPVANLHLEPDRVVLEGKEGATRQVPCDVTFLGDATTSATTTEPQP